MVSWGEAKFASERLFKVVARLMPRIVTSSESVQVWYSGNINTLYHLLSTECDSGVDAHGRLISLLTLYRLEVSRA